MLGTNSEQEATYAKLERFAQKVSECDDKRQAYILGIMQGMELMPLLCAPQEKAS